MSKAKIEYEKSIDAATRKMLRSREAVVRDGAIHKTVGGLRWREENDVKNHPWLVLSKYSKPKDVLLRVPKAGFEKMPDNELKKRIAGVW